MIYNLSGAIIHRNATIYHHWNHSKSPCWLLQLVLLIPAGLSVFFKHRPRSFIATSMGTMTGIQWLGCGGQEQVTTWLWLRKGRVNHKFLPSRSGSVMIIFWNSGYRIFIQSRMIMTCYLPIPCYCIRLLFLWVSAVLEHLQVGLSRMSLRFVRKGGWLWSIISTLTERLWQDCIDMHWPSAIWWGQQESSPNGLILWCNM